MLMWLSQKILGNSEAFKAGGNIVSGWAITSFALTDRMDCVKTSNSPFLPQTNLKKPPKLFLWPRQLPQNKATATWFPWWGKNANFGTGSMRGKGMDFIFWEKIPWEQLLFVWLFEGSPKIEQFGRFQFLLIRLSKPNSVFPHPTVQISPRV